ncbi:MAG: hypothetical protein U0835_06315 [Isosphaeraceae bacterium]
MTRKTAFRSTFEPLERRETPSQGAALHQVLPLQGSGTAQTSPLITLPAPGSYVIIQNIQGSAAGVSTFTGQGGVNVTLHHDAIGNVNLTLADGNQLVVRLKGKLHTPHFQGNPATASGTFRVLNGTGVYFGATGKGHIRGQIDQTTGAATFTFRGKIVL